MIDVVLAIAWIAGSTLGGMVLVGIGVTVLANGCRSRKGERR